MTELPVVRVKGPDTKWLHLGHDSAARGIVPEGMVLTANEQGPDTIGFTLRRSPSATWPDLRAFSQVEVEVAGVVVWGGRIRETPGQRGAGSLSLQVTGEGWQYHLDDERLSPFFVSSAFSGFRDQREIDGCDVTELDGAGVVQIGNNIMLTWVGGSTYHQTQAVGVVADYGASGVKRCRVKFDKTGSDLASSTSSKLRVAGTDEPFHWSAPGQDPSPHYFVNDVFNNITTGTWYGDTATTAKRYVHFLSTFEGAGSGSRGSFNHVFMTDIIVVSDTSYESSDASDLTADEVFTYVRGSGNVPLLSSDEGRIETTSFNIPGLGYQNRPTPPRHILEAANAYHDYLWGVDARKRLYFRARPDAPIYETGAWSAADFSDSGPSGRQVYNEVQVVYTDADGETQIETRTTTSDILDRQGLTRTGQLNVRAPITQAAAQQIGDTWLTERAVEQMTGALTLRGRGAIRSASTSLSVHPAHVLNSVGERIRMTDAVDESGAIGRTARITSASYAVDSGVLSLQLDNDRGRFEALLERLAAVQATVR